MKETLNEGINVPNSEYKNINVNTPYENKFVDGISYTEYLNISNGNISHDEIITLSRQMFEKNTKLCDIVNHQYDFVFVDEYQDTSPDVINILLESLQKSRNKSIIGFFGDSMQAIYDDGVGDIFEYIQKGVVVEVKKEQNRRNPLLVINLSNKLRMDGLVQKPSDDINAPNMKDGAVRQGTIKFIHGIASIDDLKQSQYFCGWNFANASETKELRLTHNLIANTAGFSSLMEIYDKDPIMKFKHDFIEFIKKNEISVDDFQTFEEVLNSVNWVSTLKKDSGKKQIDIFWKVLKIRSYTILQKRFHLVKLERCILTKIS